MKKYYIKTIHRNIYGEVCATYASKEYASLAIAKRYLKDGLEQVIVERTVWYDKNYCKHYADKEVKA